MSSRSRRSIKRKVYKDEVDDAELGLDNDAIYAFEEEDDDDVVDEYGESDYEEEYASPKRTGQKRKREAITKRKGANLPCVAEVTEMATDTADVNSGNSKVDSADASVVSRIRKTLELATHAGTGETEARLAMRVATKLMQSQNLTQADLIASETDEQRLSRAGQSTVTIRSPLGKQVKQQQWHTAASEAVCQSFDVQCYSMHKADSLGLDWVFYGLADNTVAAALAFEMLHNQTLTWTLERQKAKEIKGQVGANNYKLGVAERVYKDTMKQLKQQEKLAKEEEQKRLTQAVDEERRRREAEVSRLGNSPPRSEADIGLKKEKAGKKEWEEIKEEDGPSGTKVEEVEDEEVLSRQVPVKPEPDSDDDMDLDQPFQSLDRGIGDDSDDSDDEVEPDFKEDEDYEGLLDLDADEPKFKIKPEPSDQESRLNRSPFSGNRPFASASTSRKGSLQFPPALEARQEGVSEAPAWTSALQLHTFRENAKSIADKYIKDNKLKIYTGRKVKEIKYDYKAFSMGWNDGKRVDLKRKWIED